MLETLRLTPLQQAMAVAGALALFVLIVSLVYRRRLREDYAALWFTIATLVLVFAIWQDGLRLLAWTLDAVTLTAPIFLLSILLLVLLAITFSVRLSGLARQVASLARELALLRERLERDDVWSDPQEPRARTKEDG